MCSEKVVFLVSFFRWGLNLGVSLLEVVFFFWVNFFLKVVFDLLKVYKIFIFDVWFWERGGK